jgi:hypothetical protein
MSTILEGIAMSMVAAYNELQCVCQKFDTLCHYMAAVHNELQCVYIFQSYARSLLLCLS